MKLPAVLVPGSVVVLLAQIFRECPLNRVGIYFVMAERTAKRAVFNAMIVINGDSATMLAKLAL